MGRTFKGGDRQAVKKERKADANKRRIRQNISRANGR